MRLRDKKKAFEYLQNAKAIFYELGLPLPFVVIATSKGLELPGWLFNISLILNFATIPLMQRFGFYRRAQRLFEE